MTTPYERGRHSLGQEVAAAVSRGARVEYQDANSAVVVFGEHPNHVLHLLLSVFTCGFWLIIWLIMALTQKETRVSYTLDAAGTVYRDRTPVIGNAVVGPAAPGWYPDPVNPGWLRGWNGTAWTNDLQPVQQRPPSVQ